MKNLFRTTPCRMPLASGNSTTRKLIAVLVAVAFFASTGHAAVTKQCNQNGTYQFFSVVRTCTDPNTGFLVGYNLYSGFSWTSKSDGVAHSFPVITVQNSSQGRGADGGPLCGPDSIETASATATDGSGFSITVAGFNSATIFDAKGNEVFISAPISFGDPNAGQTCS